MRRTTIALLLVFFGINAHAGVITQTVNFHLAPHGASSTPYNQFNPSLGPLNVVATTVTYTTGGAFGPSFGNVYELQNMTSSAIVFNARLFGFVNSDAGGTLFTNTTVPLILGAGQMTFLQPVPAFGAQYSNYRTGLDLSGYIGTGQLLPFAMTGFPTEDSVTADSPSILVTSDQNYRYNGTETVAYYFGDSFPLPEPSSLVMVSVGLAAVAACLWRQGVKARCAG
jgi:hypothetical protein